MTSLFEELSYERDGAAVQYIDTLQEGEDITPFEGELVKPSMLWSNWQDGFSDLHIPGLNYQGCHLVAGYYAYAARGDRSMPRLSRSQALVSEWISNGQTEELFGHNTPTPKRITAFFPVYDGIGFWIGKRRRDENVHYYTVEEETKIAQASALGALGIGQAFSDPDSIHHLVYRCIWAPGRAFDEGGKIINNTTSLALGALGLSAQEITKQGKENDTLYFRLFGDTRTLDHNGDIVSLPFQTALAKHLHPAWKYVNQLPNQIDPPDPATY